MADDQTQKAMQGDPTLGVPRNGANQEELASGSDSLMGETVTLNLKQGGVIGNFRLIRRLGSGGFGEVYQAEDVRLGRHVAVKIAKGIIHRDIKPGNILLDQHGAPHVNDFGIAKQETSEETISAESAIIGTPAYMSPEQAAGFSHQADRRSDLYSLGVILYELLSGERPFRGSQQMLLQQVIHQYRDRGMQLRSVAFAPQSQLLAWSGQRGELNFFQPGQTESVVPVLHHHAEVNVIGFSPEGTKIFAAGEGRQVHLWSVPSGELIKTVALDPSPVLSGVMIDESQLLLGDKSGKLLRVDVAAGESHVVTHGRFSVNSIDMHADGKSFAAGLQNNSFMIGRSCVDRTRDGKLVGFGTLMARKSPLVTHEAKFTCLLVICRSNTPRSMPTRW